MSVKFLSFDGSGRHGSINHKLVLAVGKMVEQHGATVTHLHLPEYDLPLYNGDLEKEEGLPDGAKKLKELFDAHDGFLIASPEYNGSFSPLLKNAIDWVSRPVAGQPSLKEFRGKVAGLCSASPGKLGGLRGLYQLHTLLFNIGVIALPSMASVAFANEAFDESDGLKHEADQKAAENLAKQLIKFGRVVRSD